MAVHDWSRVDSGIFHHFHQAWTIEIIDSLNGESLSPVFFAMVEQAEQIVSGPIPDVVTLKQRGTPAGPPHPGAGVTVAEAPPRARFVTSAEPDLYTRKANRIAVKHRLGQVVAVIEVLSPGNKSGLHALRSFVEKADELPRNGIHLLVVDLFPPSPRDPQGIHKAIWDEICDEPFELPPDKPLTVAAYYAAVPKTAYVEPVAVGDPLPGLPIFLDPDTYVPAPLETTYEAT
ncbi:MAG: DUF4058 family protein [Phycisphaerae bacterium]|nr:DUF4058 family protein [Phycisphaerae bacterium]